MKKLNLVWIILLLLIPDVFAEYRLLNSSEILGDASMNIDTPTTNENGATIIIYNDGNKRAYVMYNLSEMSGCSTTKNAVWYGFLSLSENGAATVSAYEVNTSSNNVSFDETTITWNNQPCGQADGIIGSGGGGDNCNTTKADNRTFLANAGASAWWTYNLTGMVQKAISKSIGNFSFVLSAPATGAGHAKSFDSKTGTKPHFMNISCDNVTVADTTPPHITKYSNQGSSCINWNTNPSNPCSTSDTTPTLYFNTSEDANCRIGVNNQNYTTMGSSRNCTSGEGTTEHACTLTLQDELVYEDSIVYLGCKDSSGNMNTTSTSGALSLTITGLEQGTSAVIGVGVQNALLSGYTNYTELQIYARKLDGTQDTGTFDWVAKKGSKVWAFNYITKGEQHVGMFNLTPVLYVLEMSNITNATIINKVETMINATK